jgi:hypothetical protein
VLIPYSGEVALIKLAGYTLAGFWLKRVYRSRFNYLLFGILRFVTGALIWFAMAIVFEGIFPHNPSPADSVALFVSRLIVWLALIALVFHRNQTRDPVISHRRFWLCVLAGITWSYCLDGLVAWC